MRKIYLEEATKLGASDEQSSLQDSNNTIYKCDAEEQEDFYNAYMKGYYKEPGNEDDDD